MTPAALGPRPGTSLEFVGESTPRVQPSLAEVVAVPIVHDWGPLNVPVLVTDADEFTRLYGDSDTPGRTAVVGAFQGQGLENVPGAGGVIVIRLGQAAGGSAAAKASVSINNTDAVPVAGVTFTAKHEGERGERISIATANDPLDNTRDIAYVRFDGAVRERYYYPEADLAALASQVNARSDSLVTAEVDNDGFPLATTAGAALAGGADGTPLTATEWQTAFSILSNKQFTVFAPYDLTDSGVLASLNSWISTMVEASKPVIAVVGGGALDTVDNAVARSATLDNPHVVNLGAGVYHDDLLDQDLSTSQLAPRVAGILAARGEERSITFAKLGGLSVVSGAPEDDEIEVAIEGGVTVISLSESADAELKIERGITSFTTKDDGDRPYELFSDPRLIRVMDIFVRGMKLWGDETFVGGLINETSKALVRGEGGRRITDLEDRGLIAPGTGFLTLRDTADDSLPFDFGWLFTKTANYLRGRGRVR